MEYYVPISSEYEETAMLFTDEELKFHIDQNLEIMAGLLGEACMYHPIGDIWEGYELSLLRYQYALCLEWHLVRGQEDSDQLLKQTCEIFWACPEIDFQQEDPWWFDMDFQ